MNKALVFLYCIVFINTHLTCLARLPARIPATKNLKTTQQAVKRVEEEFGSIEGEFTRAFFCPQDKIVEFFIGLIQKEQKTIKGALYLLTDTRIIDHLIAAHERGVKIELVVDGKIALEIDDKIKLLQQQGIAIYFMNVPYGSMHHKFLLFGKNLNDQKFLLTGSANPTLSGTVRNREAVIVSNVATLYAEFSREFKRMKKHVTDKLESCCV